MLNFNEFIKIDNAITEGFFSRSNSKWETDKNVPGVVFNKTTIGNDTLEIQSKVSDNPNNKVHTISFHINGDVDKTNINPNIGKHILTHVAKTIHDYANNHVKKGDIIVMTAMDRNRESQRKKNEVYHLFGKRLARHINGTYNRRIMGDSQLHFIHK